MNLNYNPWKIKFSSLKNENKKPPKKPTTACRLQICFSVLWYKHPLAKAGGNCSRRDNRTATKNVPFLMTVRLEHMNAGMSIQFTWHFHILSEYYSLLAIQFQLSQQRLKYVPSGTIWWWGKNHEFWNDSCWHALYPFKTSALLVSASSSGEEKQTKNRGRTGQCLKCTLYGWKHGHTFCSST